MQADTIYQKIREIRASRVMLDFDLALLYGVTKALNQAVKRNSNRFPDDFMFQLTEKEWDALMRSQNVTASSAEIRKRNKQSLPYAFTEHGVTMLASVLRSDKAVHANIFIVRAFISLRQLGQQYTELAQKLSRLEKSNQEQFRDIYKALNYLVEKKQQQEDFSKRRRIGFTAP